MVGFTLYGLRDLDRQVSERRGQIQCSLLSWAEGNLRSFPWRTKRSAYEIVVAEILLKRTTAKAVSKVYEEFLRKYSSIKELSQANPEDLELILKPIGYSRLRSKEFIAISSFVMDRYGGRIPSKMDELDKIPYIGPYTAAALMCFAYDICAPMVDSNVMRIVGRMFMHSFKKKPNNMEAIYIISQVMPQKDYKKFNLALLDLGAIVCVPKNPRCKVCPLFNGCDYGVANRIET